jgi:hypothetical protein
MYWWQWVLQITGAWFYLGLIVLVLWHWVISRSRKRDQGAMFRDSSDGRSATRTDGRSDWPMIGLARP